MQYSGLELIKFPDFSQSDAYSTLSCSLSKNDISLILIDPFNEFLPDEADKQIPRIAEFVKSKEIPIILFILNQLRNVLHCDIQFS